MILKLAVSALLCAAALFADGGTVVFRRLAGPFYVTLFSSPEPLRVGVADLSVLVERMQDHAPVVDVNVVIDVAGAAPIHATHEAATNKLLYAAQVELPEPGLRSVTVRINDSISVRGELKVLPAQPPVIAYWPYFAIVPVAVILFAMNQALKKQRAHASRRSGHSWL